MTDERMDARLRAAGEAWRATTGRVAVDPAPPEELLAPPAQGHRRRRGALLASAAAVVAALVAGGAYALTGLSSDHRTAADTVGLKGTVWRLVGYGNERDANSTATLYISKGGTFIADDECSLITVHADVSDGGIFFNGTVDFRHRSCTDSSGPTVDRLIDLLSTVNTYKIADGALTITSNGGAPAHFVPLDGMPAPTTDVPTLEGATWQLAQVKDAAGRAYPVHGAPTFRIDGYELVASDGCNSLRTDADGSDGRLQGKNWVSTARPCPYAQISQVIDAVVQGAPRWTVAGPVLTLKGVSGTLVYHWVPSDKTATDPSNVTGRTWHLTSAVGEPLVGQPTLRIDPSGRVTGNDGCAAITGTAVLGHGTLTTKGVPAKPRASCPAEATTIDSFLATNPVMWATRDGKLLIYGGGAQAFALVYDAGVNAPPSAPSPSATLTGAPWRLTTVTVESGNSGGGEGSSDSAIALTFDGAGDYRLQTVCDVDGGNAAVDGRRMTFSGRHTVEARTCPAPDAFERRQQDAVDHVLNGTVRWSLEDGQLTLTKGGTTLTFER